MDYYLAIKLKWTTNTPNIMDKSLKHGTCRKSTCYLHKDLEQTNLVCERKRTVVPLWSGVERAMCEFSDNILHFDSTVLHLPKLNGCTLKIYAFHCVLIYIRKHKQMLNSCLQFIMHQKVIWWIRWMWQYKHSVN